MTPRPRSRLDDVPTAQALAHAGHASLIVQAAIWHPNMLTGCGDVAALLANPVDSRIVRAALAERASDPAASHELVVERLRGDDEAFARLRGIVELPDLPRREDVLAAVARLTRQRNDRDLIDAARSIARDGGADDAARDHLRTLLDEDAIATRPETLTMLDTVQRVALRWLWRGYLPLGKLRILAGLPGISKSLLTVDMAARLSRGGGWGDGAPLVDGPLASVLLCAEDDLDDTIAPRLDAAGAIGSRVAALRPDAPLTATTEAAALARMLDETEQRAGCPVGLLVVDPLGSFVPGRTDMNNEADARAALQPLRDLAARRGIAVVCVAHLRKGAASDAVHRLSGSQATGALARCVLGVAKDRTTGRRLLGRIKGNLGGFPPVRAFEVVDNAAGVPALRWASAAETLNEDDFARLFTGETARDEAAGAGSRRAEAVAFLRKTLAAGPLPAAEVLALATAADIAARTLDAAKREAGVESERVAGGWVWSLPDCRRAQGRNGAPAADTCALDV